jgi:phosphomethylpyrimidine synthase
VKNTYFETLKQYCLKNFEMLKIAKINAIQIEMDNKSAEFLANDSEIYIKEV